MICQTIKIDSKIVICDITDHLPIFYVKYGEEKRQGYTKITYRPITDNNITKFRGKINELEAALASHTTNSYHGAEDRATNYFDHLGKIYNECFPVKTKNMHNKILSKPWINLELQRLISKKDRLYGKKLRNRTPENLEKYRECKRELAQKLKASKETYFKNKLMNSNNMKGKWDAIRLIINRKKSNSSYCPIGNKILGKHYSSMAAKLNTKLPNLNQNNIPETLNDYSNNKQFSISNVTQSEVCKRPWA